MSATTTLKAIRAHGPCATGWTKLLAHLGKTKADDEPLSLLTILDSNGLDDALWCMRAMPEHDKHWRLYAVWCARQVQHLMTDPRSIAALDVAERHARGDATMAELAAARAAASVAAWAAASAAAWAAAGDAAWAAREAASAAAGDAAVDARDAASAAAWAAAWAAAEDAREAASAAAGDAAWAAREAASAAASAAAWAAAVDARDAARVAQAARLRDVCAEIDAEDAA